MKRHWILVWILLPLLGVITLGADRRAEWSRVDEAIAQQQPRTALTNLASLSAAALRERDWPEVARALALKRRLEAEINGNKVEEAITGLEADLATAPKELQPVLETLLARWYWSYFQNNRWRFSQRTPVATDPGKDLKAWDLRTLFSTIQRHLDAALQGAESLKRIPIATWDNLIPKASAPDSLRPTLYDFLVHQALEFYSAGEQGLAQPQDFRELQAETPYAGKIVLLGPAAQFHAGKLDFPKDPSNAERALFLWRDLLQFHSATPQSQAYADADLGRLRWALNEAKGESTGAQYEAALVAFLKTWGATEVGARARAQLAERYESLSKPALAHQMASELPPALRDSVGGKLCANVVARLESPTLQLHTEAVWPSRPLEPTTIAIQFKNHRQLHFRAIRMDWELFLRKEWPRPNQFQPEHWNRIRQMTAETNWVVSLPSAPIYQERTFQVPAPQGLRPGFYMILASPDPNFAQNDQSWINATSVWVSDLQILVRNRAQNLEGLVVDVTTGEPQPNAEVQAWWLDRNGTRQSTPAVRSDVQGFFRIPNTQSRQLILRALLGQNAISIEDGLYPMNGVTETPPQTTTLLFTDRGLYRPGQSVRYKGLCLSLDRAKNDYQTLAQRTVTLVFRDPNGRELARARHVTSDYGSFSGSFTSPNNSLLGHHSIMVEGSPSGGTAIQVEEYKRPKFIVTVDRPTKAPKLLETVELTGKATAYTGAPIDAAKVEFTVSRSTLWPWWCWWRHNSQVSREISHGTTSTDTDGSFKISFLASPDLAVDPKEEPSFSFNVTANVTESTGETRSQTQTIRVGYTALATSLNAPNWMSGGKPIELTVGTQSLDGIPEPASGSVAIYALSQPLRPVRTPLINNEAGEDPDLSRPQGGPSTNDLSRIENWPIGAQVSRQSFKTGTNGETKLSITLPAGAFKAVLETKDRFGKAVRGERILQVFNPDSTRAAIRLPSMLAAKSWKLEPGEEFQALWGTGYESGRAFVELTHRGQILTQFWTLPTRTQQRLTWPINESYRGGMTLNVAGILDGRPFLHSQNIDVPWSNKELELSWESFRSKLEPGQKETWTLQVRRRQGMPGSTNTPAGTIPTPSELVATLYDASLDAIRRHDWPDSSGFFFQQHSQPPWVVPPWALGQPRTPNLQDVDFSHRRWRSELEQGNDREVFGDMSFALPMRVVRTRSAMGGRVLADAMPAAAKFAMTPMVSAAAAAPAEETMAMTLTGSGMSERPPNLTSISPRKNLTETAFFFPQLRSDTNGSFRLEFTLPEALTEWRFLGFAHDRELRTGSIEAKAIASKKIMVQPNPPRFVREGDILEFTAKVSNQSDSRQRGRIRLTFSKAQDNLPADTALGNLAPEQSFDIPAKQSKGFSWRIRVPDGMGFLTFKTVAAAETASDGEEGFIPVLSRRSFITESLSIPIRGPGTREIPFDKLLNSSKSDSLQHSSLTVQVVSQPAWYAVMALPYLMEFPHECAEQTFNRWYANQLGEHIARSNPKIEQTFKQWRATPALDSPLLKNQDLKSVLIEETPWLREAQQESESRRNIGVLFDANRLRSESTQALEKLTAMRLENGAWPWFPGGPANDYVTLYITTGFGRLGHLGLQIPRHLTAPALQYLDGWITGEFNERIRLKATNNSPPSSTHALFLYSRSFFLKDHPIDPGTKPAIDFYLGQLRSNWTRLPSRQSQAHAALALKRFGDVQTPAKIVRSLRERAVENPEMGLFWRDEEDSWSWHRAPIETQALMIELFDEVAADPPAVEGLKLWLLKQKQTQAWKSTKATADAVYALLLRGVSGLGSDALVEISLGGINLTPTRASSPTPSGVPTPTVEPGTGFYERRLSPPEIKPALGRIRTTKRDAGAAWASVHWQYFEDLSKVTAHNATPLKLEKKLFKRVQTRKGAVLEPISGTVSPGDEIVVRIELRSDRNMEFVHLKDQRGSGLEPVEALSTYRYQDGLGYYASPRDTANHYFIEYLPKGTYVFQYSLRAQLKGKYQSGIAEIQCMYAPEFNAHSQSTLIQCGK